MMIRLFNKLGKIACLVLVTGGAVCLANWDIAEDWKSGELWKTERKSPLKEDVPHVEVDETTTRIPPNSGVSFGDLSPNEVLLTWKAADAEKNEADSGQDETQEKVDESGKKEGQKNDKKDGKEDSKKWALQRMVLELYNRGDNGDMDKKEYAETMTNYCQQLDELTGVKRSKVHLQGGNSSMKVSAWQWGMENGVVRLVAAISFPKKEKAAATQEDEEKTEPSKKKGRTEYIRLMLAANQADLETGGVGDKLAKKDLKAAVVHEEDGTVWIKGIPMVDQGGKGYCVPATVARVFSFYGMDGVDMHTLAAICNTKTDGGTSLREMSEGLKKIGRRYHVKIKPLGGSMEHYKFIKDYNSAAKRKDLSELLGGEHWWDGIDPDTWLAVRAKKKWDVSRWVSSWRPCIDAGIPILWSVFASGMYTDDGGLGGPHMRLLIGYNEKKGTVVYSDSWGAGAARRTMKAAEAFSVTSSTNIIKP